MTLSITDYKNKIFANLNKCMLKDRQHIYKRIKKIQRSEKDKKSHGQIIHKLSRLENYLFNSIEKRKKRSKRQLNIKFPQELPITAKENEIIEAIKMNQVLIIAGETGSGKSTQIPKMCLKAGRGVEGMIGCTQPRRIAAITISKRIEEELGEEGKDLIGYKIRFQDKIGPDAYIKVMTDGILLSETQSDPFLNEYNTLIIDEAHERSLNIDFILGILKKILHKRKQLKLIITSATIDIDKFSKAFNNAPVIEVSGRMYPVDVEYEPIDAELEEKGEITYVEMAVKSIEKLWQKRRFGDVLIFMPTEQDILETCELIEGRNYGGIHVMPLFARLPSKMQRRVFDQVNGQKIVVATNVAETSITIPGIKYVIDSGLARISQYLPNTRTTSLPIMPISQSSADQRKGRCGRVESGICIRLYSEDDYLNRPRFTPPEILRSNLAEVILRMISLNLGDVSDFPFIDKPELRSIRDGFDRLVELGAINKNFKKAKLTQKGHLMVRMPIDPRISRMIIEARNEDCVHEVAIIASALSIQDPRERPLEKEAKADEAHKQFKNPSSDFLTLLNIWNHYHDSWKTLKTQSQMRKFCKKNFLSFLRIREWRDIHNQIITILKKQKIPVNPSSKNSKAVYPAIHKSILSGLLSNIAFQKEKNFFRAAKGRDLMVFPGSGLFNKPGEWIVSAEIVETSRFFARTVANIDCEWIEPMAKDLCKYSYSNPRWSKKRGQVVADEKVSLYGLPITAKKIVPFGPVDKKTSLEIFIQSALVQSEIKEPLSFLVHNNKLIEKISNIEDKIRRRDILISDAQIYDFYAEKIDGIYDIISLKQEIKKKGGDDFLKMTEDDLLLKIPDEEELSAFPDKVNLGGRNFKCVYKFDPGKTDDGLTIKIPTSLASEVNPKKLEWMVPGLQKEKISSLLKSLPKAYRKQLVPVSKTVEIINKGMKNQDQALITALGDFIFKKFGVDIPASAWDQESLPDHLKMRVSLTDHKGREVWSNRNIENLVKNSGNIGNFTDSEAWKKLKNTWERTNCTQWDFKDLPESININDNCAVYPGLEPASQHVNIKLFENKDEALNSHKKGIMKLFTIYFAKDLKFLKKCLKIPSSLSNAAIYFDGSGAIENEVYENVIKKCFHKNIRTKKNFEEYVKEISPQIISLGENTMDLTLKILEAYHETRSMLHSLETTNLANPLFLKYCKDLRKSITQIVPKKFSKFYDSDRLSHIPRYLKAISIRAERAVNSFEKDKAKAEEVKEFYKALQKNVNSLTERASNEKRKALEDFFWMIEEYKVSLFAQELKTAIPVSKKRLKKFIDGIERMV